MARSYAWRKLRASLRDTRVLLREFSWPLLAFCSAILGGGILYYSLALKSAEPETPQNLAEAIYQVLALTFLQPINEFPSAWYLEAFYFLMPLIGIGILAQGVADFGVLFFNRRARSKEWEIAVASTLMNHIILVGLGHLGFRVVDNLHELDQDVVVIEANPKAELVASVQQMGHTVIHDDGRREATLEAAGVRRARAIMLCTQNDSLNLQIAVKARSLNPDIEVVLRIFDDDFASALQEQFGFAAMSATGLAAPAFAAAGVGVEITRPIIVEGEPLSLAKLTVDAGGDLDCQTVGELEARFNVSVVHVRSPNSPDFHPSAGRQFQSGDVLAILGGPKEINGLLRANRPRTARP
jgi:Trk K+ transport system NAD-binding subunit